METVENYGSGHDFAARGSLNVFLFRISAVLLLVRELQKSTIQKRFSFDEWTKWITKITVPPFVSNWSTSNAGCKFSSRSSNSKERHIRLWGTCDSVLGFCLVLRSMEKKQRFATTVVTWLLVQIHAATM